MKFHIIFNIFSQENVYSISVFRLGPIHFDTSIFKRDINIEFQK